MTYHDEKMRITNNIRIERFWKSIRYNHMYQNPCYTGPEPEEGDKTLVKKYYQK
jgi:hypothetical protein